MDNPGSQPSGRSMPSRGEFDEDGYLQLYPDIAAGVASGAIESGWAHFKAGGFAEGRPWVARPDPLLGVSREIAANDEMFAGNPEHYFNVGESALRNIEAALVTARRPRSTIGRILDLPCGHGRVMRFLRQAFPAAELVACDLDRSGVDFCARTFGAVPEYSEPEPEQILHQGVVDLIWCGSLLTHLSEAKCRDFLRFFHRILGHRGLLVFTLHGRFCQRELASGRNRHDLKDHQVVELLEKYQREGFGFVRYVSRPEEDYGFSLAHPSFVTGRLTEGLPWRLIGHHESGWDGRQDVICLQKSLDGTAADI